MIDVETSIEPPGLDELDDGGEPTIHVHLWFLEGDGTSRGATAMLPATATDDQLAAALAACVRGVATMRGPGLVAAVERRLR